MSWNTDHMVIGADDDLWDENVDAVLAVNDPTLEYAPDGPGADDGPRPAGDDDRGSVVASRVDRGSPTDDESTDRDERDLDRSRPEDESTGHGTRGQCAHASAVTV